MSGGNGGQYHSSTATMTPGLRGCVGLSDYTGRQWFFKLLARCIRFFTKGQWSHTFCVTMEDELLGPIVEEAGPVGVVNASLDDYIAAGGFQALRRVLSEMASAEVRDEVMESGLRGRGGAGFPTGLKWTTVAKATGDKKYVICNADEGDPGAFMDRSVLESDPFRVLEGMAIAAFAVHATEGYVYCRAEYPLAWYDRERGYRAPHVPCNSRTAVPGPCA